MIKSLYGLRVIDEKGTRRRSYCSASELKNYLTTPGIRLLSAAIFQDFPATESSQMVKAVGYLDVPKGGSKLNAQGDRYFFFASGSKEGRLVTQDELLDLFQRGTDCEAVRVVE